MLPLNSSHFAPKSAEHQHLGKLTDAKIKLLERTTTFTLHEKVELLGLLTHHAWVTDVNVRRGNLQPDQACVEELTQLELPWRAEHYVKRDGTNVYWLQVGANEAILDYMEQNKEGLSVLEAGIFYGYPPTAVLGCVNILKSIYKAVDKKSIGEFYLSGVFSADFIDQEVEAAVRAWDDLAKVSPKIIAEAKRYYKQWHEENDKPLDIR
jgi:hypothetical protein